MLVRRVSAVFEKTVARIVSNFIETQNSDNPDFSSLRFVTVVICSRQNIKMIFNPVLLDSSSISTKRGPQKVFDM